MTCLINAMPECAHFWRGHFAARSERLRSALQVGWVVFNMGDFYYDVRFIRAMYLGKRQACLHHQRARKTLCKLGD